MSDAPLARTLVKPLMNAMTPGCRQTQPHQWNHYSLVVLLFLLSAALVSPVFFPSLSEIGVWDEAGYINEGRDLLHRKLPSFTMNPAVAGLYALTYLPVHASPYWLAYSCSIGRFLFFGLLWLGSFLVATQLAELASPFIMIALVMISPALANLLTNGSNALFAAMSGFALWQFLVFLRIRQPRQLWFCSFFLGLAALSRNEGTLLFLVFLALSLGICIPAGLLRKGLMACLVPFAILVGGYVLLYGLRTGDFDPGIAKRTYNTFEQGHGMAFADSYGTKEFYTEGLLDARRLFGTPEENHHSVLTAILRNPAAYFGRIPGLARHAVKDATGIYGWYFGLLCFVFAARGLVQLVATKSFLLLATLVLWPAYCVLYVLLCYQPGHLFLPYLSVFSLASVGISAFSLNLSSRRERFLWSAGLVILVVAAAVKLKIPNGPLVAVLSTLLGFWVIWLVGNHLGTEKGRTAACLILLSLALVLRFGLPSKLHTLGNTPDDQAVLYLREHFPPGTQVGAWGLGRVYAAKMDCVTMVAFLRYMKSAEDLLEWMNRENVSAIYVDDSLRKFEPDVWNIVQKQIGTHLRVVFDSGDGDAQVQILVRASKQ